MRLYLGGQMRGLPDFGHALFDEAEKFLTSLGHEVFNPARYDRDHDTVSADVRICMAADMAWISAHSQGMILLENWRSSLGAKAELAFHHALGLPVWEFTDFYAFGPTAPKVAMLVPPTTPLMDALNRSMARRH
jgi:nucleoside 2-deoxyribosyltransferase